MNSSEARNRYRDAVRTLVGLIPAGRVLAYGDIAELLGCGGPRQVGRVMSHFGDGLPWWRVTRADGRPAEGHDERALVQYRIEETPLRYTRGSRASDIDSSWRVAISRARWQPSEQDWARIDELAELLATAAVED